MILLLWYWCCYIQHLFKPGTMSLTPFSLRSCVSSLTPYLFSASKISLESVPLSPPPLLLRQVNFLPPHCSPRLCSLLFFKPPSRLQPEWPIWNASQTESLPQCCPQSWHQTLCRVYGGLHFQAPAYFSNLLSPYTAITLWDGAFFTWK